MECWWPQPSSVSGMQLMAAGWDFADIQNQLDGIVRNKAIYLKVATALGPFSTLDHFSAASYKSCALSSACFIEVSRKVASSTMPRTQT